MTIRYVGLGGSDAADGLSWATRKLTLNGAEDAPVAAGDEVVVGPGTYREQLTCDVSGSAGSPVTYTGDVTGQRTDGVGGIVRITGSDNDIVAVRNYCVSSAVKHYRTFRGFAFDMVGTAISASATSSNWIIEDCSFYDVPYAISIGGGPNHIARRCLFGFGTNAQIFISNATTVNASAYLIENCVFITPAQYGIGVYIARVGGITIRNCNLSISMGVQVATALAAGQVCTVNNCVFTCCITAVRATTVDEFVENYNTFYKNGTDRNTVNVGANSIAYPPLFQPPLLAAGYRFPMPAPGELSSASLVRAIAGTSMSTDDLYGVTRPTTDSKKSWGAVQYQPVLRETGTVHAGSVSLKLSDAGESQFVIPTTAVPTTISVWVYREADYAGTNPRMVISQPGVADRITTDAGAAAGWNALTDTFTPATSPGYVIVKLQSLNTAAAGNYDVFFDDLAKSP